MRGCLAGALLALGCLGAGAHAQDPAPTGDLVKYCEKRIDLQKALEQRLPQGGDDLEALIRAAESKRQAAAADQAPAAAQPSIEARAAQAAPVYAALREAARTHRAEAAKALAQAQQETDPAMRAFRLREAASRLDSADNALQRATSIVSEQPAEPRGRAALQPGDSSALEQLRQMAQGPAHAEIGFERGRVHSAPAVEPAGDRFFEGEGVLAYDAARQQLVLRGGERIDLERLAAALSKVDARAARGPLFVPDPQLGGALRPSQALREMLADPAARERLRQVGGVDLQVTFDFLSLARVSDFRGGARTLLEKPVLISLANLLDQARRYAGDQAQWHRLPEALRYPGDIARIHGVVLEPVKGDVLLVGVPAARGEERLDIDALVLALDSAWLRGESPAVSLDPLPDDVGGPQYPRVEGMPLDSVFARVMLDADYTMKRIMLGEVDTGVAGYRSALDLFEAAPRGESGSRFWFYPRPLGPGSVFLSDSGRTVLFDSALQVLTEAQRVQHGMLTDSGESDEQAQEAAREFSAHFEAFKRTEGIAPRGVFTRLHGLLDAVTAARLLRAFGVDYRVLHDIAALPYRKLVGDAAVPAYYRGLTVARRVGDLQLTLSGGVQLRARPSARALDRYRDAVPEALESIADRLPSGVVARPVGFSFTTSGYDVRAGAVQQALRSGSHALASREYAKARAHFLDATAADALDAQAWAQLALVQSALGDLGTARASAERAAALEPADPVYRLLALDVQWQADPAGMLARSTAAERRGLSDEYVEAARLALGEERNEQAQRLAERAMRLWDRNGEAYMVHAAARPASDQSGQRLDIARAIRAYRQALAQRDSLDLRQRLALALSQSAMQRVLRVTGLLTGAVQRGEDTIDLNNANADLDRATQEVQEAQRLDSAVPLPAALEIQVRVMRAELMRGADLQVDLRALRTRADEVVQRYPDFPLAHAARAMAAMADHDLEQALADANRSIELHPGMDLGYFTRAMIHDERGDCDAAAADWREARKRGMPVSVLDRKSFMCPGPGT